MYGLFRKIVGTEIAVVTREHYEIRASVDHDDYTRIHAECVMKNSIMREIINDALLPQKVRADLRRVVAECGVDIDQASVEEVSTDKPYHTEWYIR